MGALAADGRGAPPILRSEGLTVRFGGLTALNSVTLDVRRGEIRAIIGPNGAGKSTFFNCLTGVIRPTAGRVLLDGEDITGLPPYRISQKGIARSYQITNIMPGATVLENVRVAAQSRRHAWSLFRHHRAFADVIDHARGVLHDVGLIDKEIATRLAKAEGKTYPVLIELVGQRRIDAFERAPEIGAAIGAVATAPPGEVVDAEYSETR